MVRTSWAAGLIAIAAVSAAAPAAAQSIQIGPDGIRVVPQEQQGGRGEPRGQARQGNQGSGISERDAVRVARSEGMHEIETVSRSERAYRIVGLDRRGDGLQVDVDRRSGQVISVR